ncbi:putative ring-cleavage extradiol dioxygenase [Linnemannia elongata]|nr:putative ring-cleavage extradiol dioxygenase [Linnemannia elongata]
MSASVAPTPSAVPILRFARPTASLSNVLHFYQTALGLHLIASFDNHRGFDGRILSPTSGTDSGAAPWHLEFTYQHHHASGEFPVGLAEVELCHAPTQDNLLVLYLKDRAEVEARKARMEEHGYHAVKAINPYWDDHGFTFEDSEGWRVVLCWLEWTK